MSRGFPLWSVLILLVVSSASAQTLHYDRDLLLTYARLCQQLRKEMADHLTQLTDKYTPLSVKINAKKELVDIIREQPFVVLQSAQEIIDDLFLATKSNKVPAIAAMSSRPFNNPDVPIFNDLTVAHGMIYSTVTGEVTITKTGVYVMEFKNQGKDYNGVLLKVIVLQANGLQRTAFTVYTDWEVSGHFSMLYMEYGDNFQIQSFKNSGNPSVQAIVPGPGNVFFLRYQGKSINNDNLPATSPPEPTTTPWIW